MPENILAIDTSLSQCSIALRYKNQLFHQNQAIIKDYAQTILPLLSDILSKANAQLSDIDRIVYTQGPGSYTGLRICCSVVQGICFIHNTPVFGISSLALLAQGIHRQYGHTRVLAVLNAHMQQVYWGYYEYNQETHLMCAIIRDQVSSTLQIEPNLLNDCVIAGNGWDVFKQSESYSIKQDNIFAEAQPDAIDAIDWVDKQNLPKNQPVIDEIVPIYLRDDSQWKKIGQL